MNESTNPPTNQPTNEETEKQILEGQIVQFMIQEILTAYPATFQQEIQFQERNSFCE